MTRADPQARDTTYRLYSRSRARRGVGGNEVTGGADSDDDRGLSVALDPHELIATGLGRSPGVRVRREEIVLTPRMPVLPNLQSLRERRWVREQPCFIAHMHVPGIDGGGDPCRRGHREVVLTLSVVPELQAHGARIVLVRGGRAGTDPLVASFSCGKHGCRRGGGQTIATRGVPEPLEETTLRSVDKQNCAPALVADELVARCLSRSDPLCRAGEVVVLASRMPPLLEGVKMKPASSPRCTQPSLRTNMYPAALADCTPSSVAVVMLSPRPGWYHSCSGWLAPRDSAVSTQPSVRTNR